MKLNLLLILFAFILTATADAGTNHSKLIKRVQEKYANQFTEYPILIMDIDEISFRYLQKNAYGLSKEKEVERAHILIEYVEEKIGVELTLAESIGLEPYTTVLKESAVALPVLGRDYKKRIDYEACVVFPASPNSNKRLETHRILQLDTPGAYENVNYEGLQETLEYNELKLFSLYHELGHCMDRTFMPEMYTSYEPDPHDIHLAESFAEVFGLMIMEMEGYKGTALKRALFRNMYSVEMGKWFVANPQNGFGNPLYKAGGAIYYLVPALLEARKRLEKRKGPLVVSNLDEIKDVAADIVKTAGYEGRSFNAIKYWFFEGQDKALDMYQDYYLRMPELFDDAFGDLSKFIFQNELLYKKLAGKIEFEVDQSLLPVLDTSGLCSIKNNEEELYQQLNLEREQLSNWVGNYEDQVSRKANLDGIYEYLQTCNDSVTF